MKDTPEVLLEVRGLQKYFPVRKGLLGRQSGSIRAVDGVTFSLPRGTTLGLVGESGCGKSTLARCIVRLLEPTAGDILFQGRSIAHLGPRALRPFRDHIQMIFQDPYASLNPRKRVGSIVSEPLTIRRAGTARDRRAHVTELLERVGLAPEHYRRYPSEFSGGQRQRVGIARALTLKPKLIVADEPVSALDVSIQAQILNLLRDLQDELGLTYLFISHDLRVVRHVSDRIAVMYLGQIMELSSTEDLYRRPIHPYTEALLAAVPIPDPDANTRRAHHVLEGDVPSLMQSPSGCHFHPRCPYATAVCREVTPPLVEYRPGHAAACHHPLNVLTGPLSPVAEVDSSNSAAN